MLEVLSWTGGRMRITSLPASPRGRQSSQWQCTCALLIPSLKVPSVSPAESNSIGSVPQWENCLMVVLALPLSPLAQVFPPMRNLSFTEHGHHLSCPLSNHKPPPPPPPPPYRRSRRVKLTLKSNSQKSIHITINQAKVW